MPSREHVRRAKAAMKRVADLERFFEKLTSPHWITPLEEEGFFNEPWPPQPDGEYVAFPFWPQSKYLIRMASQAPELVLGIIERIPETENVRIHEDFIDSALGMPAAIAARIVSRAIEWLKSPYQLLLPNKLGTLLRHLVAGGEIDAALKLAAALLWVDPDQHRGRPRARYEEFFYREILKEDVSELVKSEPRGALRILCDALQQAVTAGHVGQPDDPREDYSNMWQPAVEEHKQNNDHDVRPALVGAVRAAAEAVVAAGSQPLGEVFRALDERPWKIFTRIGLHLAREFADRDPVLAKQLIGDKARAEDTSLHHEYWQLAKVVFPLFSTKEQEDFLDWLEAESQRDEHEAEEADNPQQVDHREKLARHWLYRRLLLLKEHLPTRGTTRLQELQTEFSGIEHPEFLSYSTGVWTGPTSPKSVEELSAMSVDELVGYLRHWKPSGALMDDSIEGLARTISPAVARDPEKYALKAFAFAGLDPTYVRAFIAGLREARKQDHPFPWDPVLDLCEWVVAQDRTIPGRSAVEDHDDDADPDWGWTRREIAGLLEDGLEVWEGVLPQRLRDRVWGILAPLTDDPDPTPEHEVRYGGDNMDPLTLSINSVRGMAMHAVVKYALWVRRHLEAQGDKTPLMRGLEEIPGVRQVLEDHLRIDRDSSLATRAVYGQWLPWLNMLDPNWTRLQLPVILPRAEDQRQLRNAAWGTYVLYSGVFNDAYGLLRDDYSFAIDRLGEEAFGGRHGDRPDLRLVDHLMLFYARGLIDLHDSNDLIQRFYRTASVEFRERAISFLGHALYDQQGDGPPREVQMRFQELLDFRIDSAPSAEKAEEFAGFGWWFASGRLDPEWSMSRLITILRAGTMIEAEHLVVKQLAAMVDSVRAVEALRWVAEVDQKGWGFSLWAEDARAILQSALEGGNDEARKNATLAINLLAARGNRTFVDLLDSAS